MILQVAGASDDLIEFTVETGDLLFGEELNLPYTRDDQAYMAKLMFEDTLLGCVIVRYIGVWDFEFRPTQDMYDVCDDNEALPPITWQQHFSHTALGEGVEAPPYSSIGVLSVLDSVQWPLDRFTLNVYDNRRSFSFQNGALL